MAELPRRRDRLWSIRRMMKSRRQMCCYWLVHLIQLVLTAAVTSAQLFPSQLAPALPPSHFLSSHPPQQSPFFFYATKNGLEAPSGRIPHFVHDAIRKNIEFADFSSSSFIPLNENSRRVLGDNLKLESVRQMRFVPAQSVHKPRHIRIQSPPPTLPQPSPLVQQPAAPSAPSFAPKWPSQSPFRPVFGARLTATTSTTTPKPEVLYQTTTPRSTLRPSAAPRPNVHRVSNFNRPPVAPMHRHPTSRPSRLLRQQVTTPKPTPIQTTTVKPPPPPLDDEFDIDYIDNSDDRLKGVTHLNLTQDDLWHAESVAMEQVLKAHIKKAKPENVTHLLGSASEVRDTKLPERELGLNLDKYSTKELDFNSIFSNYKSPGLNFDPFKIFEEENGITTQIKTTGQDNRLKINKLLSGDSIEYLTSSFNSNNNNDNKRPNLPEGNEPIFVPFGSAANENNNKLEPQSEPFTWSPPVTFPSIFTTTTPTSTTTQRPFTSFFDGPVPNTNNININPAPTFSSVFNANTFTSNLNSNFNNFNSNSNLNAKNSVSSSFLDNFDRHFDKSLRQQQSPTERPFLTTTTTEAPPTTPNLATYDLKKAYENLRAVRKDYAEPVSDDGDGSSRSSFKSSTSNGPPISSTPIGSIFNEKNNFANGERFFTNEVKLSDDFYTGQGGIPDKYLTMTNTNTNYNGGQQQSSNNFDDSNRWKGIDGDFTQQNNNNFGSRIEEKKGPHVPPPPAALTTTIGESPNNRPISRLIPKASVEVVPLPPVGEYNVPEIIHNGDHIVRVEKVPLKNLHDAYYNPEIPEETHEISRIRGTTGSASKSLNAKGSKLRSNGRKNASKSKRKGGTQKNLRNRKQKQNKKNAKKRNNKKNRKNSKQTDTSIESPVIDDVTDEIDSSAKDAVGSVGSLVPGAGSVTGLVNTARGTASGLIPNGTPGVTGVVDTARGVVNTARGTASGLIPNGTPGIAGAVDTARGVVDTARGTASGLLPGATPDVTGVVNTASGLVPGGVPAVPGTDTVRTAVDAATNAVGGVTTESSTDSDDSEEDSSDDDDTETEKEDTTTTTTTEKPDSEDSEDSSDEDTETQSEKPSTDDESSSEDTDTETTTEDPGSEEDSSSEDTGSDSDSDSDTSSDDDDSSSGTTTTTPAPTTTTTPKPYPRYPPFPFPPPPFPPFFYPPYPPPPGFPYPPPPPGYPPLPYPPPYGAKAPYGSYPPKYPPPPYPPKYPHPYPHPPPKYGSSYPPKPVSYTYTNTPPPPKYGPPPGPYPPTGYPAYPPQPASGPSYPPPPPPYSQPPPPAYSPNAIPHSPYPPKPYYPAPAYPPQKPYKDDGYGDKGNPPVDSKMELNVPDIQIPQISIGSPKKPYYPPQQQQGYYQGKPMSYYQYNYRRNDETGYGGGRSGGYPAPEPAYPKPEPPSYEGPSYSPPPRSQYSKPEYNPPSQPEPYSPPSADYEPPKEKPSYGYKKPETVTNINADIYLGDMMISGQDYGSQAKPKYPVNVYAEEMYPSPEPQRYQGPQQYPMYPPPSSGYNAAKKPSYFESFKNGLKRLLPKLRPNSGDPYPPKLDANYNPVNGSETPLPWNLGENEAPSTPTPIMYNCAENRIGKCIMPPQAWYPEMLPDIGQPQSQYPFPGMPGTYSVAASDSSQQLAVVKQIPEVASANAASPASATVSVAGQQALSTR